MVLFLSFKRMNKLFYFCGIIALTIISCSESNRGNVKEEDALQAYDSVLIGCDQGFSRSLTSVYWVLNKNGIVKKNIEPILVSDEDKDTVTTIRIGGDSCRRIKELAEDMFVKGTVKDVVAVRDRNFCTDLGGLYVYVYYPGKTVRHEYEWGKTGVKYSSEFNELMKLIEVF